MAKHKPQADLTVLASSTHAAIVEGWEMQNRREVARARAPVRTTLNPKGGMRMSGGQYAAGQSVPPLYICSSTNFQPGDLCSPC